MDDSILQDSLSDTVRAIELDTRRSGFSMASDPKFGAFLRLLAASKPGGRFLELGTGTGLSAAWLLDGMDAASNLLTVDNDASVSDIARRHLGHDPRIRFLIEDGAGVLRDLHDKQYDLVFADAWPGKFWDLDLALALLAPGGFYVIDDMLPHPDWPEGHAEKVSDLLAYLSDYPGLTTCRMAWSSGIVVAARSVS